MEIYNDGACIRIVSKGMIMLINKLQIKTIDTIKGTTLRLDIGEGALRHVYINVEEVVEPDVGRDVAALRELIKAMLSSSVSGGATEAKQDEEIGQLQSIVQLLSQIRLTLSGSGGGKIPMIIDESNPFVVYYGYAAAGSNVVDPVWAIKREVRQNDLIITEWADGNELFDNVWQNRLSLTYISYRNDAAPSE